ncbi:MAG TPA: SusC/RagA family TonB-linked outer membrane protein [Chitinophagaceae bacterium]
MRRLACSIAAMLLLLLYSSLSYAQERTVTGTVLADDSNNPLVGVTVTNLATNKKVITNSAGSYSIQATKGNILRFNYVGYAAKDVVVGDERTISVRLVEADKEVGNVVVTAYGRQQSKRELPYQAPVVAGDEVSQTRRENFLNALAGRVPGLSVTSTSGLPGASAQIILRGGSSIAGNNQPLFVVDGVPLDNSALSQESLVASSNPGGVGFANRNSDYTNRIADINPADIESITILKGPEATALYGSDGASGAIIITTKKGAPGRVRVSYDNSFRWDKVYRFPEIQTVYSRGTNGIYDPNAYSTTYGFRMFGPKYPAGTPIYNNLENFFQTGRTQQHNISLEAGSADATFRFSAGVVDQQGVVPNTDYDRVTLRLTGSAKLGKKLNVSSSWGYFTSDNDKSPKGAGTYYPNLINWPVDVDASDFQNADGTRKVIRTNLPVSGGVQDLTSELDNPFWDVNKNKSKDKSDRVTGNINLGYDPARWLNLTTIVGIDAFSASGLYMTHPLSRWGFATKGFLSTYEQIYRGLNGTFRATFRKTFANKFSNTLVAGFYFEDNKREITSQRGERFYEQDFISINNTDPTSRDAKLTNENTRKVRFYGNYTFGFNNILYISLSGTNEGTSTLTSRFTEKYPFYSYGSASASFIFSDLNPIKNLNLDWLSYGKLRASFASVGKGPVVPYAIDYSFGSQITTGGGYALGVTGNNFNLKPEMSKNLELGTELKFFKNRFGIDFAWFNNRVKDLIISNRLSYGTGFVLKYINGGELSAKGIELQLTGNPVRNKNFNWDITLNFDKNKVVVEKMPADLPLYYDSDTWLFGNLRSQVSVGASLGNLSGTTFRKNDAGQLLISPTSGLPITDASFQNVGDRNPDFRIGLINSFTILKDWNLSFNLDIRKGGDIFNANELMMRLMGTSVNTLDRETPRVIEGVLLDGLENTATPTKNTIAITPYLRNDYYNGIFAEGDFVEEVDWIRLRDITLAYRLPESLIKRQRVFKQLSLFVTGTDLFMITNYSGVDPNVNGLNAGSTRGFGGQGIDFGAIPTPRGVNIGLKAQF